MDMEDSKSSSEESDRLEQSNDDADTGRSYKCVFCKRGFTTAQALGGHMNIHRKDRPKPRRNSSVPSISSKAHEDYASCAAFPPIEIFPSHYTLPQEVHINYQTYFPAPTFDDRSQHAQNTDNSYVQNAHHLNPFTEGWPRSLSLQIGPSNSHIIQNREDGRKEELDLELRLGYHQ